MANYNVKLTVSYDGTAVTAGAGKNAQDIGKFTAAQQNMVNWSAQNAARLQALQQALYEQSSAAQRSSRSTRETSRATNESAGTNRKYTDSLKPVIHAVNQNSQASAKLTAQLLTLSNSLQAIERKSSDAAGSLNRSANAANYYSTSVARATTATATNNTVTAEAAAKNNTLTSTYRALAGAVGLYAVGAAGINFIRSASDAEMLQLRLENLTTSASQNAEAQRYLEEAADRLNVRYSVLADSYTRLLVLERQRTVTATESREILEGMTNVARTLGASNVQVSQAMYGMTQAFTQGRVQAQELNQVVEPLPGLLQALDKAAGVASGGFRRMVVDGEVTSQMFKRTLITALKDYEGAAEGAANTMSAAFNDFLSEYDNLAKRLSAPINSAIVPLVTTATSALETLGDNVDVLDDLAVAAGIVAAVYAGRLTGSIATAISQKIADVAASNAQLAANQRTAASTLTAANTQLHYAQQLQQGAVRQLAAAKTDATRAAAVNNLAAANTRLIAAQRAATVATTQYTAASTAATISTRGLSAAMALVGGPVGVAVTAALAIGYFMTSANDAEDETEELSNKVETLTERFKGLTAAGRALEIQKITDQEVKARENLIRLQERLTEAEKAPIKIGGISGVNDFNDPTMQNAKSLQKLREDVDEANALLDSLAKQKENLFNSTLPGNWLEAEGEDGAANDAFAKDISDLETFLEGQEGRINASYIKRQKMLDKAYEQGGVSQQKYNDISTRLELQRDQDISEVRARAVAEEARRQNDMYNAELNAMRVAHEQQLAEIQGFESRKALLQYQYDKQLADQRNQQQILFAQGFNSQSEADEHARQEALLRAQTSRTGEMQSLLFSRAEWERKNELEKTDAVLAIGEYGFKQMAGQSKKAFAMYKAFSIAKAVINTYEMATGAFNALAPIPVVGPALGAAAAAAAIAFGINQVATIKNQQYSAAYHGGVDYVANEQTALIQRGERIVSPRQNVALTQAVDTINSGKASAGNVVYFNYSPVFSTDGSDNSLEQIEGYAMQLYAQIKQDLIRELKTGTGEFYSAARVA